MHHSPLLGPVVALVAWTLLVMGWMAIARAGEFRRLGIKPTTIPNGARGQDLEGRADPRAQWKAHNYAHLVEQPTIFYAIVFALILMGFDAVINVWLAWAYVGLRVLHSILQSTVNIVRYRLVLFGLSSLCLIALTLHAAMALIHG
ncbi:MAPEG family protein [Sphingomonas flavescens]|uniref:MAPEG family protein n=1 Tax=Sphingomonas flavescens TaxID=3132797 RepID=UPI0028044363|nr:MAPEG family protein [Sphingomonas limnosediminicola]